MNKILLVSAFLLYAGGAYVSAQEPTPPKNIQEMMTSLKPADGRPYVFYSQKDLEAAKAKKIDNIKQDIRRHHENPARVKALRESLWRMENAVVQELPK